MFPAIPILPETLVLGLGVGAKPGEPCCLSPLRREEDFRRVFTSSWTCGCWGLSWGKRKSWLRRAAFEAQRILEWTIKELQKSEQLPEGYD